MMFTMSQTRQTWKKTNAEDKVDYDDDNRDKTRTALTTLVPTSSSSTTPVPAVPESTSLATWWKRTPAWRTVR